MTLEESINLFVQEKKNYYKQWIFDQPVVISKTHNSELSRLQGVLEKLITHFVTNYTVYENLMPVNPNVKEIFRIFSEKEYKIGTYRTDFVYDQNNQVRLLEITCRFALNGMFLTSVMEAIAKDIHSKSSSFHQLEDLYSPIIDHLENYLRGTKRVVILKGKDRRNESKIFASIFERLGLEIINLELSEIDQSLALFQDAFIICELGLEEIIQLKKRTIKALRDSNLINDLRTVFLIHDKRFFSVLCNKKFRLDIISKTDNLFFEKYLIPTFNYKHNERVWNQARYNKEKWVLKHATLGKSQSVYAGIVTSEEEWQVLFDKDCSNMVIQEWIHTNLVKGSIDNELYEDYITGTLIFFDDKFFGFGDFRTSSFPVTNKVDHRKACTLVLNNDEGFHSPFLKYL